MQITEARLRQIVREELLESMSSEDTWYNVVLQARSDADEHLNSPEVLELTGLERSRALGYADGLGGAERAPLSAANTEEGFEAYDAGYGAGRQELIRRYWEAMDPGI